MELNNVKECEYCDHPIEEEDEIYQVMVYDKHGKQEFLKVCSETCAFKCREISFNIHINMADSIKRQMIQKLR